MSADPRLLADALLSAKDLVTNLQAYADAVSPPPPPPPPPRVIITDRQTRPKPAPLALGPAGFAFTDPTFGSPMLRLTDETTEMRSPCRIASNEHVAVWNADSSACYCLNSGGGVVVLTRDGVRIPCFVPGSNVEPSFSYVDPDILFIVAGPNGRTIQRFSLKANAVVGTVFDCDAEYPKLSLVSPRTYVGSFMTTDEDQWILAFGGQGQDDHRYVRHSNGLSLDTLSLPQPFKIHAVSIDRTGRYVILTPTGADIAKGVLQAQLWDTQKPDTVTPIAKLGDGHDVLGYGLWINKTCCSAGDWDALQWQFRVLDAIATTRDLVTVLRPKATYTDDHTSWRAAQKTRAVPMLSATYRYGLDLTRPWRAWDDEVIGVATDGSGTVQRFCHHQSIYDPRNFWTQPLVAQSPDGKWALVHSNWGQTVGAGRQDVFRVSLT